MPFDIAYGSGNFHIEERLRMASLPRIYIAYEYNKCFQRGIDCATILYRYAFVSYDCKSVSRTCVLL